MADRSSLVVGLLALAAAALGLLDAGGALEGVDGGVVAAVALVVLAVAAVVASLVSLRGRRPPG
jgi:ABC-type amino acid transport substrate-binding protein